MIGSPQSFFSKLFARMLNGVRNFIVSRGGIIFAVLCVVFLLIWFVGPSVGLKSVKARVWVLAILTLLLALVLLIKWWLDRRRGKQLQQDMEEAAFLGTRPDRESEIALLRKQMQDAIGALKSSELVSSRTGSAALYALPWYMLIGASAVGKSSILRNSNLNFPYSKHDPRGIQGLGGTRNCDWWFSDQAVFLDTAGRYITEEEDRDEWYAFLSLLRNHRSKQPINGVIVAVNIADLLTSDNAAVLDNAKIVRDRIDELVSKLGIIFPVYLVFTKTDLIKGFASYFDDLSDKERDQVWGASTVALEKNDEREVGEIFTEEFDALHARLCAHRMVKISMQRELERKSEIMDMPNQFQAAGPRLTEFVNQVFKKSPYKETPIFGGFFFTSATQQGAPIQYLHGSEMQAFGAAPHARSQEGQKAYFIHNLLREVILPNTKQAGLNKRMVRRERFIKRFSTIMAIIIAIVGIMMLSSAYNKQLQLIAEIKDSSKELARDVNASPPNVSVTLKSVVSYYNLTGELWADEESLNFMTPGGLQEPLAHNFLLGMQSVFLNPVGGLLEERLNNYTHNIPNKAESDDTTTDPANLRSRRAAAAYSDLKLYLFLSTPGVLEHTSLVDSFFNIWISALNKSGVKAAELDKVQMKHMLSYYIKHMRTPLNAPLLARQWSVDKNLIASVRAIINQQPSSERLYAEMRDVGSRKIDPVDLLSLVNGAPRGALISSNTIPGIYTRKGWETFVWPYLQKTIDESLRTDWVLGNTDANNEVPTGEMREQLVRQIRQMYFADYTNLWFNFVSGISARKFDSLHDASSQLQSFTSDNSAILELLKSINLNVAIPDPEKGSLLSSATDKEGTLSLDGMPVIEELRIPFKHLIRITQEAIKGKEDNWFSAYQKSLNAVQKDIAKLASASDVPRDTRLFALKLMNGDVESELYRSWLGLNQVLEEADTRTSQSASNLLRAPIINVWATIIAVAQKDFERTWKDKTLFTFNETLRGHYPFVKEGSDASMNDIADFFKPKGGTFLTFVNDDMGAFVERKGNTWEARKWLGIGLEFNPQFLQIIARTLDISDSLFKRGEANPGIAFGVFPTVNSSLSESSINIDGTDFRYRNGPQEWNNFIWPGQNPGARIRGIRVGKASSGELAAEGPWALLRLLDRAHISSNQRGSFQATWALLDSNGQRMSVSFMIKPDRNAALLQNGALQSYSLPTDIFLREAVEK